MKPHQFSYQPHLTTEWKFKVCLNMWNSFQIWRDCVTAYIYSQFPQFSLFFHISGENSLYILHYIRVLSYKW